MIGVRIPAPLGFQVEGETKAGRVRLEINWDRLRPGDQVASLGPVTPVDGGGCSTSGSSSGGSGTWGRSSGPPKKEELVGGKKKGRTWGPSSTLQKERAGGEERYRPHGAPPHAPRLSPRPLAARRPMTAPPHLWCPLQAEGPGRRKQTVVIKCPQPGQIPQTHTHRPRLCQPQ